MSEDQISRRLANVNADLAKRIVILDRVMRAAYNCLGDGEYHGEDCPGDDYDLEEGQGPGECECGILEWREAIAEAKK